MRSLRFLVLGSIAALVATLLAWPCAAVAAQGASPAPPPPPPAAGIEVEDLAPAQTTEPAAPAVAAAPDPLVELERNADQAYGEGNLETAILLYRQVSDQHSKATEKARLLITVAWLEQMQSRSARAAEDLERALFLQPDFALRPELYSPEFVTLFQEAQPRAIAARSRQANERIRAALTLLESNDYAGARSLLRQALALQPNHPRALYNLAVVDQREGKADDALGGFEKVVALEHGSPGSVPVELRAQAENNLGVLYFGRGQFDEAEAALAQAVALSPQDGRAWSNLGLARQKLVRKVAATDAFRRAHGILPFDVDITNQLASMYIDTGSWVEAVAVLVEATRAQPEVPSLWLNLGLAQRGLGNPEGSAQSFARVIDLDPDNRAHLAERAASFLALTRFEQGRWAEAADAAQKAIDRNPSDVDAWVHLGLAQKELGDLVHARESLEKGSVLAPQRAEVVYNLGSVYLAQKDLLRAEWAFRKTLELQADFPGAADILQKIEAQKNAKTSDKSKGGKKASGAKSTPSARPTTPAQVTSAPSRPSGGSAPPLPPAARSRPKSLGVRFSAADYNEVGIKGLLVESVAKDSVAEQAGLLASDLVLRIDGREVGSAEDLYDYIYTQATSDTVTLDVLRSGRPVRLKLKVY